MTWTNKLVRYIYPTKLPTAVIRTKQTKNHEELNEKDRDKLKINIVTNEEGIWIHSMKQLTLAPPSKRLGRVSFA